MKKYMRITIMERRGICGTMKPCEYVVNKKFCENWGIPFENHSTSEIRRDLESFCNNHGIKILEIR